MGANLVFVFEIKRQDFTKSMLKQLIRLLTGKHKTEADPKSTALLIEKLYADGKGDVATVHADFPYLQEPKGMTLAACTTKNPEFLEDPNIRLSPQNAALKDDACWIYVIVQEWELSAQSETSQNPLSLLLEDLVMIYMFLKPQWARGDTDIAMRGYITQWSQTLANFNLLTPEDVKMMGLVMVKDMPAFLKMALPDGGMLIQFNPLYFEKNAGKVRFDYGEIAKRIGYRGKPT